MPLGGFNDVWRNEQVWPRLGCAVAPAEVVAGTEAYLYCAHSIWLRDQRLFVILPYTSRHGWGFVPDESGTPPDAPLMVAPFPVDTIGFEATGRHGWLASAATSVDECKGLSKTSETPFEGQMQQFEGGWLLWNGDVAFVLFADGNWIMF